VIANTRELVNQIHSVYEKIVKGTDITLANFNFEDNTPKQITVTTHGKIQPMLKGRKTIDLTHLKCIVVDEADVFFLDEKNNKVLKEIANYKDIKGRTEGNNRVQWILFSATYPEGSEQIYEQVQQRIAEIVTKAQ